MCHYYKQLQNKIIGIKQIKLVVVLVCVLLALDILDLPSKLVVRFGMNMSVLVSATILILGILTIIDNGILDALRVKAINQIDVVSFIMLLSSLFYLSIIFIIGELHLYKVIITGINVGCLIILTIIRVYQFNKAIKKSENYNNNIVDLKDLYEGSVSFSKNKQIILEEKDVDYDLLNRSRLTNFLYDSIISTNPSDKFVISLVGEWGKGKTTILNNVKNLIFENNKEIVVIDEFDPWIYKDERSLFENMLNALIQKSGLRYNIFAFNRMIEGLSELVFGGQKYKFLQSFFLENNILRLKEKINNFLELEDKKYVFIIDNIDRAEKDNIILLFKIVGNILDFKRVTYVLSFDEKRVKRAFETDSILDYEYVKKIINLSIHIPALDSFTLNNVYNTCLKNILVMYGENEQNLYNYNCIISFLSKSNFDIRDFKRFLNTVINYSFNTNHYLNMKDLIIMELIKLNNYPLYQSIYDNREYFISHDRIYDSDIYPSTFDINGFNNRAKQFYQELFEKELHKDYSLILEEIFPYVKKYNKNEDLVHEGYFLGKDLEYEKVNREKGICSAKYFELYFTSTNNIYIEISIIVDNILESINCGQSTKFREIINSVDLSYHREIFERLQLFIDNIERKYIASFIKVLFLSSSYVDSSIQFFRLNAEDRLAVIIHKLVNKISDDEYDELLKFISDKYTVFEMLHNILYWYEHDNNNINIDGRKERFESAINEMVSNLFKHKLDLYSNEYYKPRNIWGLYHVSKGESGRLKKYIKSILNKDNIYRFLNDMISVSMDSKYRYSINIEYVENFSTLDNIELILNSRKPKSEDEKFILEVYNSSLIEEDFDKSGITVNEEKRLIL